MSGPIQGVKEQKFHSIKNLRLKNLSVKWSEADLKDRVVGRKDVLELSGRGHPVGGGGNAGEERVEVGRNLLVRVERRLRERGRAVQAAGEEVVLELLGRRGTGQASKAGRIVGGGGSCSQAGQAERVHVGVREEAGGMVDVMSRAPLTRLDGHVGWK